MIERTRLSQTDTDFINLRCKMGCRGVSVCLVASSDVTDFLDIHTGLFDDCLA